MDNGQKGFSLIELLVVIGILGALAAVTTPLYYRFFGQIQQDAVELQLMQDAMDAMMADNLLVDIVPQDTPTNNFTAFPISDSAPLAPTAESLFPGFLRNQATRCGYTWGATGRLTQFCGQTISAVSAIVDNSILTGGEDFEVFSGTFHGNIMTDELWDGTITVAEGVNFDGNIENHGDGNIFVTIGTGNVFSGNIMNKGNGVVTVSGPGTLDGNVENEGTGMCTVSVGIHNGNKDGNCT